MTSKSNGYDYSIYKPENESKYKYKYKSMVELENLEYKSESLFEYMS